MINSNPSISSEKKNIDLKKLIEIWNDTSLEKKNKKSDKDIRPWYLFANANQV